MSNIRNIVHVWVGIACFVGACSEKPSAPPTPSSSTDSVSTPASERAREATLPAAALPAPAGSPVASDATDPCAGVDCGDGFCDVKTVQCVRAPCPPVGTCVGGTHPCAAMTCATDSRCESHDGQGVCIPLASDSAGPQCGKATCEAGQVCCNESCGICTAPDGACTQQACE